MTRDELPWRERIAAASAVLLPGSQLERRILLALLLLAAVLRFWDLPHIPYTHDEISALLRVYPTLSETISKGVVALDTHPPGVQVFEWCWTRLFGMGEAVVKLPFILMSLAALVLLYRFMYAWCGSAVALIALALLATMQYTVMYGQIARPYAAGLFTTALLADQLTRYVATGSLRSLVGLIIGAVLSAYAHHFALMLAGLMYLTCLFLIAPSARRKYLLAGALCMVLYIPNVSIFFHQFGQKGLEEWLTAPTPSWLLDYGWWLAHCSWTFAVVVAVLVIASLVLSISGRTWSAPVFSIVVLWGFAPLAIGYAYSVWRAPVLQYSVVLFSFPYLLMGALAGLRRLKTPWVSYITAVVAFISVTTLISVRKHYATFYRSKYEAIALGVVDAAKVPGRIAVIDAPERMINFYLNHWGIDSAQAPYVDLADVAAVTLPLSSTVHSVFYGCSSSATPEHMGLVQQAFPFMTERHDMVEGQTFVLNTRPSGNRVNDIEQESIAVPEAIAGAGWKIDADIPFLRDSSAKYGSAPARWDLTGREYGLLYDEEIGNLATEGNDVIEAVLDAPSAPLNGDLVVVMELKDGDSTVFYRHGSPMTLGGSTVIAAAVKLADMERHGRGMRLRTYVWNRNKGPVHIASFHVRVRRGDPWLYGFYQPLRGPLRFP